MLYKAVRLALTALAVSLACAQTPAGADRVFYLTHTETSQQFQEIVTTIRAVADVKPTSVSIADKAFTVHGTDEQIKLVDWLVNELNRPAPDPPPAPQIENSTAHEYRVPGGADDVVRVFFMSWSRQPQDLQEMATLARAVADIRWIFTYNTLHAMTVRGRGAQVAIAEWLVNELNRPAADPPPAQQIQNSIAHAYRVPGGTDDVVRVFFMSWSRQPQDLQEIATVTRLVADIQRMFTYNRLHAMTVRGTAAQVGIVEWLVNELNKPVRAQDAAQPGPNVKHEYQIPGGTDESVRVFYLAHTGTPREIQQVAVAVREGTQVQRLFINNAQRAIAVRGSSDQIASAERLIRALDHPAQ